MSGEDAITWVDLIEKAILERPFSSSVGFKLLTKCVFLQGFVWKSDFFSARFLSSFVAEILNDFAILAWLAS